MATTIDALLKEHLPHAQFATETSASLSVKAWTNNINPIANFTPRQPTWEGVHRYLGPGLDLPPDSYNNGYRCPSDTYRLNSRVERLNPVVETIVMEGEVQRDFDRHLGLPLTLAFGRWPCLKERSLAGPPGHADSVETIDTFYSFGAGNSEIPCIAGDLKRPGVIKKDDWTGQQAMTSVSRRLGKEIRGYAHKYNCPQVFVFDSLTLLLVQFHATNRGQIKSNDVPVSVWVIPRTSQDGNICTARYALYWMAYRGLMRVMGQQADAVAPWNGPARYFQYFSGRPYWAIPGNTVYFHPDGRTREWHMEEGYFYWSWKNEQGQQFTEPDTLTLWNQEDQSRRAHDRWRHPAVFSVGTIEKWSANMG